MSTPYLQCYGCNTALLHHNRIGIPSPYLHKYVFLSYITILCHSTQSIYDPSIHNNTYSFKPNLHQLLFLTLMSPHAKPSPKLFHQTVPPSLPPISLPLGVNPITNHQQGSKLICILSNRKEPPPSYSTIVFTLTMGYIAPSHSYT